MSMDYDFDHGHITDPECYHTPAKIYDTDFTTHHATCQSRKASNITLHAIIEVICCV
ncbi:hypothetical protein Plhal703r1_c48g0151481 [Plasmopara halstedii]